MTDERWDRIAQIYQKAAELPSDERDRYVREACGSDAGLQAEVESLLAQADAAVLIDRPVWEAAAEVLDDNPAVPPGSMIGPFRVESLIGEGGMGHVYRARDTTLQRDVALKVLPAAFARDPDRLARFSREAQVLASLNHPHIAAIYGFERGSAEPPVHALVLEFVDGPTLVDLIAQGPMRIDEALPIARQIADALEAAHEQGIIHRDLKPANVKVRPDGTVKVLDFGLAKVFGQEPDDAKSPRSPVGGSPVMTAHGLVLGTATYTSPEQAKGRSADKRSDVWSFGCVLFEMLAGRRAFEGVGVAETLAAIVRDAPEWSRLPADTPRTIVRLLERCLEKDPRRRLPAIAAARFDIDDALAGAADAALTDRVRSSRRRRLMPWAIAAALAISVAAAGVIALRSGALRTRPDQQVIQFSIAPPENALLGGYWRPGSVTSQPQFAISPDGRHIAIVVNTDGVEALWLRSLDADDIRRLPGTEGAGQPFWSPDSRWIAFFAAGQLKKLSLNGGPPIPICDTGEGRGGTWGRDNMIVFKSERPETETKSGDRGLQQVSAEGGPISAATRVDDANVISHAWPFFLPDGRRFLYIGVLSTGPWGIWVGSLDAAQPTRIGTTESAAIYGAGHIFFWRDGSVLAQPFDPAAGRTVGDAFAAAGGIGRGGGGDMSFSISGTGTAVRAPAVQSSMTQLFWMDRAGNVLGAVGEPARNAAFALSPDGRWIAVTREGENSPRQRLWLIDTASNLSSQFTFGSSGSSLPLWSPDGTRVAFARTVGLTGFDIFLKPVHGGAEERLMERSGSELPSDWARDGRYLLFTQIKARDLDVWALPLVGDRKPFAVIESPSQEEGATFSPDGRWIAYQSDESGEHEVYVQSFPSGGAKARISPGGGRMPQWRADGREVFYFARDGSLMAAPISAGAEITVGNAQRLFATDYNRRRDRRSFSVSADGRRFLLPIFRDPAPATPLTVIVNWSASVAR